MERSESAMNRVGRVMWTVWGYLTGTVGRYLRPELSDAEGHDVPSKKEDTGAISTSYKELRQKEVEEERTERKAREDCPGVRVRTAAVQWEKGNVARGHDATEKNSQKYPRSEGVDETLQMQDEIQFTDQEHSRSEEDLNIDRSEIDQEKTKEEKTSKRDSDESEEEPSSENAQEEGMKREEEEHGVETLKREDDENEEESINSEFLIQGLLEADLNIEKKQGKDDVAGEIPTRENDETEEEHVKLECSDQALLASEADLHIGTNQEQRRKTEEEEEVKRSAFNESEDGPIKSDCGDQTLLTKDDDDLEKERKQEEECVVDEIMKTENDEREEESVKCEFIDQGRQEEEEEEEGGGGVEIIRREYGEQPFTIAYTEEDSLANKAELNVEWNENHQKEGRKQEEEDADELSSRANDEIYDEPIEYESIHQGYDLNVKRSDNQEEEEEYCFDELTNRGNDESEDERVKNELIDQGMLGKETDLYDERSNSIQEQTEEEEDELSKRENDETEEQPVDHERTDEGLLASEGGFNVERNEDTQERRRKEEEVNENLRRAIDESEDEPITPESVHQDLLTKHDEDNVERSKSCEEEEDVQMIRRENDETGQNTFIRQGLLASEVDLSVERNKSNEEEGRTSTQEEEGVSDIDETEEHPIERDLYVERNEHNQEQTEEEEDEGFDESTKRQIDERKEETIDAKGFDQGLEPEDHVTLCDMGDTAVVQVVSVEKIYDRDQNELMLVEDRNQGMTGHDSEASKSQVVDEGLVIQLASAYEEMNDSLHLEVDMTEDAMQAEKSEKKQGISGDEEVSAREQFTGTDTAEEEKVSDLEMKETQVVDRNAETEREHLETEIYRNVSGPSGMFEVEAVVIQVQQVEENKEQQPTAEATNLHLKQLLDIDHDHSGSQQLAVVTKQNTEGVITRPATGTGNQIETVETTSKFRAEVAAQMDVMKSAVRETSSHEQPTASKEAAVQDVKGQRLSSSLQDPDECSTEAEPNVEAKSSAPEHTDVDVRTSRDEVKYEQPESETPFTENSCDESALDVQINQDGFGVKHSDADSSSCRLTEALDLSEGERVEVKIRRDSQKGAEEQESTGDADTRLSDEINDVTCCLGMVEEITSGLSKDAEWELQREIEAPGTKEQLEGHKEPSKGNMNETWECEKEMIDNESMVVSTGGEMESMNNMEEPIKDKSHLGFSQSDASKAVEENIEDGESVEDRKEDGEERGRLGQKRGFEQMAGVNASVSTDLLLPSQASSLDFTHQKSKIAVKNPLIRPPKDPRMLINMASVEPLTPPPRPSQPALLKKTCIEGASGPSKGVIGFKLPGLGAGFPALKKTAVGIKMRDEDSGSVASQKSDSISQSADDNVKQESTPPRPKWTPPRQPGMGNPMMMAELKSKLKKPVKE